MDECFIRSTRGIFRGGDQDKTPVHRAEQAMDRPSQTIADHRTLDGLLMTSQSQIVLRIKFLQGQSLKSYQHCYGCLTLKRTSRERGLLSEVGMSM